MPNNSKPDRGESDVSKKAPQPGQPELQQRQLAREAERKAGQAQHSNADAQNRIPSRNRVSDKDADNPNSGES
jgi:hypothetical protein